MDSDGQPEPNTNLGTVATTVTQVLTITDLFTAEDIAYAREKYIGQGFDYEAAKAPDTQKKVGWLAGMKRESFAVGIGSWFRCGSHV